MRKLSNIYYDSKTSNIHEWYYDENNARNYIVKNYSPFLFTSHEFGTPDGKSIYDEPLTVKKFRNSYERNKFTREIYKGNVYFNLPCDQQYVFMSYHKDGLDSSFPIRSWFLDIEVDVDPEADGFPSVEEAKFVINVISCHDSLDDITYTWGLEKCDPIDEKHVYFYFDTEKKLLKDFSEKIASVPDILVTWNGEEFDIPYIVNRMRNVGLSPENLSPIKKIFSSQKLNRKRMMKYNKWDIVGISHVDYKLLFEYMFPSKLESYSLEYVTTESGLSGKLKYEGSLYNLSVKDWKRFVEYNIQDVRLMVQLEEKKSFLQIARNIVSQGYTTLNSALGKVRIIEGCLAKSAWDQGKIIPSNKFIGDSEDYDGGFVKEPIPGIHTGVVVFDVNSLYPNTMITLNISPEKKIGKVLSKNSDTVTFTLNERKKTCSAEDFDKLLRVKKYALSSCDIIFDQSEKGIIPTYLDKTYNERVRVKELMEITKDADEIKKLDNLQYTIKILINSVYGACGCKFFCMYDVECAESVTATGQNLIKKSALIVEDLIDEKNCVVASDTDSLMVKVLPLDYFSDEGLTQEGKDLLKALTNALNDRVKNFCKTEYFSIDSRCKFGWEVASDYSLFLKKKHYVMRVRCSEGKNKLEYKYRGISVRKSTISKEAKVILKDIFENHILTGKTESEVCRILSNHWHKFSATHVDNLATRTGCRNMGKYTGMTKGVPYHVKASFKYNDLIEMFGLKKYPLISDGDDIKVVNVLSNSFGIERIAYKTEFPHDIGLVPDYYSMWEKTIESGLKTPFEVLGWKFPNFQTVGEVDLFELFASCS
jgi:DNA polymerase elongation subunit (family B)